MIQLRYRTRWVGPNGELPNRYPPVFEDGTRIRDLTLRLNVPLADLHVYPNGEFCIGFRTAAPDRQHFDLPAFIEEDLIAWLYRLSYVERFGLDPGEAETLAGVRPSPRAAAVFAADQSDCRFQLPSRSPVPLRQREAV